MSDKPYDGRHGSDDALHDLVAGTSPVTGQAFFPALVEHLAAALNVRMAVVTECLDDQFHHVRQLARWKDGSLDGGLEYDTDNTPCSKVLLSGGTCYYPDHVQEHFPGNTFLPAFGAITYLGIPLIDAEGTTLGHLYVVDSKPLANPEQAKAILSIFASRAAIELLRQRTMEALRTTTSELRFVNDLIEQTTQPVAVTELNGTLVR